MAVESMETAKEAMALMEMSPGALPHPSRVPEQRLLFPKICLQWRRCCGTVLGKTPIILGFSVGRLLIGEGASSEVDQGGLTMGGHGQGLGRAPYCVASLWPLFGSRLVLVLHPGNIGVSELVSSNSENISSIAFLKHKNSRK
jgi:hypothetical protein